MILHYLLTFQTFRSDMNRKILKKIKFVISTTVLTLTMIGINSAYAALIGNPIKLSQGSSNAVSEPSLAYNSVDQEYIAVWRNVTTDFQSLTLQRFTTTGSLIEGNINLSRKPGVIFGPVIAYNSTDNQYLVSFGVQGNAIFPYNSSVGQLITADSKLIGDNFSISSAAQETSLLYNPQVNEYFQTARAFDPDSIYPSDRILGQRIKSDGTLINSNIRLDTSGDSAPNGQVALDSVHNRYLATWGDQESYPNFTVQGSFINADSGLISKQFQIVPPPDFKSNPTPQPPITTTFDSISQKFFVAYGLMNDTQLRGDFVDQNGTSIGSKIILDKKDNYFTYDNFSIAFNKTLQTYLVASTSNSGLIGQFFDTSGNLIGDRFTIASGIKSPVIANIANNDLGEFVIAWETPGRQEGIFAQRINTSSSSIPEPSTIFGIGVILAALPVLKKEYATRNKKALEKV